MILFRDEINLHMEPSMREVSPCQGLVDADSGLPLQTSPSSRKRGGNSARSSGIAKNVGGSKLRNARSGQED